MYILWAKAPEQVNIRVKRISVFFTEIILNYHSYLFRKGSPALQGAVDRGYPTLVVACDGDGQGN
jgi:hypothetical protein